MKAEPLLFGNHTESTLHSLKHADGRTDFLYTSPRQGFTATLSSLGMVSKISQNDIVVYERFNGFGAGETTIAKEELNGVVRRLYEDIRTMHQNTSVQSNLNQILSLFQWTPETLNQRFGDWRNFISTGSQDIVPGCDDESIVLTVSGGCKMKCGFCPMADSFSVFDWDQVESGVEKVIDSIERHHPDGKHLVNKGIIGSASLSFFAKSPSTITTSSDVNGNVPTALEVVKFFREKTQVTFISGFMDNFYGSRMSLLEHAALAEHVQQVRIGMESGNQYFSTVLDKNYTLEQKQKTLDLLLAAGYSMVRPIVMTGLAESVKYNGTTVTWQDAIHDTVNMVLYKSNGTKRTDDDLSRITVDVSRLIVDQQSALFKSTSGSEPYVVKMTHALLPRGSNLFLTPSQNSNSTVALERHQLIDGLAKYVPLKFGYEREALPFKRGDMPW